jgi:hypothetical protein
MMLSSVSDLEWKLRSQGGGFRGWDEVAPEAVLAKKQSAEAHQRRARFVRIATMIVGACGLVGVLAVGRIAFGANDHPPPRVPETRLAETPAATPPSTPLEATHAVAPHTTNSIARELAAPKRAHATKAPSRTKKSVRGNVSH